MGGRERGKRDDWEGGQAVRRIKDLCTQLAQRSHRECGI